MRRDSNVYSVPECRTDCVLDYRHSLLAASRVIDDVDVAADVGGVFVGTLSTWLLAPVDDIHLPFQLGRAEGAATLLCGLVQGEKDYRGELALLDDGPYATLGDVASARLRLADATITVAWPIVHRPEPALSAHLLKSAEAVAGYLGKFPVREALALVLPRSGGGLHGRQLGVGGASVLLWAGPQVSHEDLTNDWVVVHEFIHLAVPRMARDHLWLSEGLATYVEPIARFRAGLIDEEEVWRGMIRGFNFGLPRPGDRGLDHTPTWGRIYWGGALFAFFADLQMITRSKGAYGLDAALRGAMLEGASTLVSWDIDRYLGSADRTVGDSVLTDLYAMMGKSSRQPDLSDALAQLGISGTSEALLLDPSPGPSQLRARLLRGESSSRSWSKGAHGQ